MDDKHQNYFLFLKWFFFVIVLETVIVLNLVNSDLLLFKVLLNYLFLLAVVPLILEKINKDKIDLFSPIAIFSFSYIVLFGIVSLDLLIFRSEEIRKDEEFYTLALFYSVLGLHFFQFGYFSKLGRIFLKGEKRIPNTWSTTKLKILSITFSIISFSAFLIIVKMSGGFFYYFSNILQSMRNITTGSAVIFMCVLIVKIPVLIWLYYSLENKKFSFSFFFYLGFVIFLFVSLGERGHLMFLVLSMLICYHYVRKRLGVLQIFALTSILSLFLIVYAQYREFTAQAYNVKKAGFNINLGIAASYHNFVSNFDQLERVKDIVKYVPEKLNYQYGKTFFNLMLKPIPSRIWEGKPQGAGIVVTKSLYPRHYAAKASIAPSLLGELYLNFHVIGVIAGMFLFGVFAKGLYLLLYKHFHNRNFKIFYSFVLPTVFGQLRGDFAVVNSFLLFNLIFLLLSLNFITIKTRGFSNENLSSPKNC